MIYAIIRAIARFLLVVLNGFTLVKNKQHLPKEGGYVLICPHRSWLDPIYLALAASPKQFCFMAKKELFKNPLLRWLITSMNAFPVDRENPGPSAIKIPVAHLKDGRLGLVIFPSGSRHTEETKAGAAAIARLAKVPIIPAVYQGPDNLKDLLLRKKTKVNFGKPIYISSKADQDAFADTIKTIFAQLDSELDPNYTWAPKPKK